MKEALFFEPDIGISNETTIVSRNRTYTGAARPLVVVKKYSKKKNKIKRKWES